MVHIQGEVTEILKEFGYTVEMKSFPIVLGRSPLCVIACNSVGYRFNLGELGKYALLSNRVSLAQELGKELGKQIALKIEKQKAQEKDEQLQALFCS